VSSEDGGGAHTASAGLRLLWLGLFECVQAATAAVVISPPRALLLVASGGGDDGAVPVIVAVGLSSGCRCRVAVVILVIGTLFSSWRALAGAGYLLRGWGWSVVVVGRWVLTCWYLFLFLSFCGCWWWLVVVANVAAIVVLRGEGGVVVWWKEMVEFRMLVEFEPREFSHMTSLTRSKRRWFFTNLHVESLILLIFSREFSGV